MILLDTNVLSELMSQDANRNVIDWINSQPTMELYTSSITQAEIEFGIALMSNGKRKEEIINAALAIFKLFRNRILPFDNKSASYFATVRSHRQMVGRPISFADAQIAAIALQNQFILSTRNIRDFENIEGLKLVNPWEEVG